MNSCQIFTLGLCKYLAWPSVTALCIFLFKTDIQRLLSRLTKLPGGTELNPETLEKQQEDKQEFDNLFAQKYEGKKKELEMCSTEVKEEVK
jgi:hypothetical protein